MGDRDSRPPAGRSSAGDVADPSGIPVGDDFDLDADFDRWVADIEAGRCRIPGERELEGPAFSISLGDAADLDPALLAAMCGPDGLGGTALSAAFGQDNAADVLCPGPVLSALTEQAVSDLAVLSDDQLIGTLSAARRLENRAAYLQTVAIAEFARRRLAPKCRRHHRCKQAPGWKVEQPEPGVIRWTVPSGRVYSTRPTVYDLQQSPLAHRLPRLFAAGRKPL